MVGAHAVASACRALSEAGHDRLVRRERALTGALLEGLNDVPAVRVLSLFGGSGAGRVGVVSFVVDGWDATGFADALSAGYGIGVRAGLFCAHPLLRVLLGRGHGAEAECGAASAGEGSLNAVRVSLGVGTPDEHVARFLGAVRDLVRRGHR